MNNTSKPEVDPKTFFRTISIIHLALLGGQLLFFIVAITQTPEQRFVVNYAVDPLIILVPAMAIGCFIMSNILFRQQLGKAVDQASLADKLSRYQSAAIIRFALIEGASLFAVVAFLKSGNLLFCLVFAVLILTFIVNRPNRNNIESDLNLSYEEKMSMN